MEQKITEFEQFSYKGYNIHVDLLTAWFDGERLHMEGTATKDNNERQVTVTVRPEDTPEFNNSISASDGTPTKSDLEQFKASLVGVEDSKTQTQL